MEREKIRNGAESGVERIDSADFGGDGDSDDWRETGEKISLAKRPQRRCVHLPEAGRDFALLFSAWEAQEWEP